MERSDQVSYRQRIGSQSDALAMADSTGCRKVIVPVALSYLGVIAINVFFFGRYVHYNADQMEVGFP